MLSPNFLTSIESLFNRFITSLKAVFLPTPGSEANSFTAFSRSRDGNSVKLMIIIFHTKLVLFSPVLVKAKDFLSSILFVNLVN